MKAVKSHDTGPEIKVRSELHRKGFRFKLNLQSLPGCPDIVLPKYRTLIFVNGCFWHGHECKYGRPPNTRQTFWVQKIQRNKLRDQKNINLLKISGWKVIVVWQCELKNKQLSYERLELLERQIIE
ncbi:MAG TPA: DNA mismatch endonuclease Vsr [bacterium]|nr:DNA mismatch endonuclease Vsr [bacterium]